MNEQNFKDALRHTMTAQPAPPPMNETTVLDAARRDRRRRRTTWAGVGSAVAVVAIAVGVVVLAPSTSGGGGIEVGTQPPATGETKTSDGASERTETAGPQYDLGVTLRNELRAVVPAGYESPTTGAVDNRPLNSHQAKLTDIGTGAESWQYLVEVPVRKGEGLGRLLLEVRTSIAQPGDGCDLPTLWGLKGECTEVLVGGQPVAVFTSSRTQDTDQFNQWAAFRHDDGTVVYLAQASDYAFLGQPALGGLPLTTEQLAALAADPRFNVG